MVDSGDGPTVSFPAGFVFTCPECGLETWLADSDLAAAKCHHCQAPYFANEASARPLIDACVRLSAAMRLLHSAAEQTGMAVLLDPSGYEAPAGGPPPGFYIGMPPPNPETMGPLRRI